ncbi:hypothetical protein SAMN03003324_02187 [Pedobacter antarcticus]|uniref:Uncharacterized protein n=1 Tax=Pedobacter antarcticus TaxID=34086 RepID=A0A1I2FFH7_9SPHI|nr:hypothetical protein SAMN03003324_02187 [Pedobacter antarcticus]
MLTHFSLKSNKKKAQVIFKDEVNPKSWTKTFGVHFKMTCAFL